MVLLLLTSLMLTLRLTQALLLLLLMLLLAPTQELEHDAFHDDSTSLCEAAGTTAGRSAAAP